MKTIEIKKGNKTTFKIVPDDYKEEKEGFFIKDLTTSGNNTIGYSDIDKEKWDKIFGENKRDKV